MASIWTFFTSGHVASTTVNNLSLAADSTSADTPWALKIVLDFLGISNISSTKIAPLFVNLSTTCLL